MSSIFPAQDVAKAVALQGFHLLSGANQTGRFGGRGKLKLGQALVSFSLRVIFVFTGLGKIDELSQETEMTDLIVFMNQGHPLPTTVNNGGDFRRKEDGVQKLSSTRDALKDSVGPK